MNTLFLHCRPGFEGEVCGEVTDLAARLVLAPAELPIGIITALLGGPFFLYLLVRGRA